MQDAVLFVNLARYKNTKIMKLKIEYSYNGKRTNDLESAVKLAAAEGIRNKVWRKIQPFEDEILACGGTVTININENLQGDLILNGMPEDLKQRIIQALV